MTKPFIAICCLCAFAINAHASNDEEQQLLKSWGIKLSSNGGVSYQSAHKIQSSDVWVSSPIPDLQSIDYSTLSNHLKPLVINTK